MMMVFRAVGQSILAFGLLYLVVRLIGKQEVSQGTFWNLTSAITLGSLAGVMATAGIRGLAPAAASIITWGFLTIAISWVVLKSRSARALLEGKPAVIIQNGKLLEETMRIERYDLDRMMADLRAKGVSSLADVEFAILETTGSLSVILKSQAQPVTPADLKLPTGYTGLSAELIMDGQVVRQNLAQAGLTETWLLTELSRRGITDPADVMLAALDTRGRLFLDLRQDRIPPAPQAGGAALH